MFKPVFFAAVLASSPVAALEICDDLWFTRNLVFDRAGYCFGSELGKAVFGNEGCVKGPLELDDASVKLVARLRGLEKDWNCKVDTSQSFLAVHAIEQRKALVDLPMPTGGESGCLGWLGERIVLRAERKDTGAVVGAVRIADTLLFQFEDVDGWSFVEVLQNDIPAGQGWAKLEISNKTCAGLAG